MKNTPLTIFKKYTRFLLIVMLVITFAACTSANSNTAVLQAKVDSLNQQIAQAYKPGLGEFMSGIQVHHAKLYFAGKNQNWKLADFEMGEIKEAVDDIKKYCADRPEVKSLSILYPALDSVNNAIKAKSLHHFETSFLFLTNSCNSCHKNTNHAFNVIKVPDTPPFNNQDFKVK
jgi:hypothetical protein